MGWTQEDIVRSLETLEKYLSEKGTFFLGKCEGKSPVDSCSGANRRLYKGRIYCYKHLDEARKKEEEEKS